MTNEIWVKQSNDQQKPSEDRAAQFVHGQIVLADHIGLGKKELYAIAQQADKLLNSGKLEEARVIYQGLVAAEPDDSAFHCHLGAVEMRLGKTNEAFKEFDAALQRNIANGDALVGRGEIHLMRGALKEAVADLRAAIELDKENKRASTARAKAALLTLKDAFENQRAMEKSV